MRKLMFAVIGSILLITPKNVKAQETEPIILPEAVVTADCFTVTINIGFASAEVEVCEICVNGYCHYEFN